MLLSTSALTLTGSGAAAELQGFKNRVREITISRGPTVVVFRQAVQPCPDAYQAAIAFKNIPFQR